MQNAHIVWNAQTLDKFLTNPRAMVPGTRMSFAGLRNEEQRKALIAWLQQATAPAGAAQSTGESSEGQGGTMGSGMQGGMMGNEESSQPASGTKPETVTLMPGTTGLILPTMDAEAGKKLFVSKGCVACHAVNGVGGKDAPALDASTMAPLMNPFDLAAKMWRMAPLMIAAQEKELGGQILFTGAELADIVAFLHDPKVQATFTDKDLTPEARSMMMDDEDMEQGGSDSDDGQQ